MAAAVAAAQNNPGGLQGQSMPFQGIVSCPGKAGRPAPPARFTGCLKRS